MRLRASASRKGDMKCRAMLGSGIVRHCSAEGSLEGITALYGYRRLTTWQWIYFDVGYGYFLEEKIQVVLLISEHSTV